MVSRLRGRNADDTRRECKRWYERCFLSEHVNSCSGLIIGKLPDDDATVSCPTFADSVRSGP
jgi:hypothetical protein